MPSCAAYRCMNTTRLSNKKKGVTFHKFPKEPELRRLWTEAINRIDWEPTCHSTLCSEHFEEKDMDRTSLSCVRVREGAVPSMFPSTVKSHKGQTQAAEETVDSESTESSASKGSTSASVLVAQEDLVNSMETDALDNSDDSEEDNKNAGSGIVTDDQPLEQRYTSSKNSQGKTPQTTLSYSICCFKGCTRSRSNFPNLHFYKFPVSKADVCEKWLMNCKDVESLQSLPLKKLCRRVICEKHFDRNCYANGSGKKKHILKGAIPTITVPDEDIPLEENNSFENQTYTESNKESLGSAPLKSLHHKVVGEKHFQREVRDGKNDDSLISKAIPTVAFTGPVIPSEDNNLPEDQELKDRLNKKRFQDMMAKILEGGTPKGASYLSNKCSFPGCTRNKKTFPNSYFYKFPVKRKDICKKWLLNCAENKSLQSLPKEKLGRRIVCDAHFAQNCYRFTNLKRRLNVDAVPTLQGSELQGVDQSEVENRAVSVNFRQILSESDDSESVDDSDWRLLRNVEVEIKCDPEEEISNDFDEERITADYNQGPKSYSRQGKEPPSKKARLSDPNEPSTSAASPTDPQGAAEPSTSSSSAVFIKSEPSDEVGSMSQDDSASEPSFSLPFSMVMVKEEPIDEDFEVKTEEINIFDDHFATNNDGTAETGGYSIDHQESFLPESNPDTKDNLLPNNDVTERSLFEITLLRNNLPEHILPTPNTLFKSKTPPDPVKNEPKSIILEKSFSTSQGTQTKFLPEKPMPVIMVPINPSFLEAPNSKPQTHLDKPVPNPNFPEKSILKPQTQLDTPAPSLSYPEPSLLKSQTTNIQTVAKPVKNQSSKPRGKRILPPDEYDQFGTFVALSLRSIKQKKYKDKLMRIIRNAIKGVCQEDLSSYTPETHLFKDT